MRKWPGGRLTSGRSYRHRAPTRPAGGVAWPMARARSVVLWMLTIEVVVLLVTGIALSFLYRPDAADAFSDVSASLDREITFASVLRDVHGWAAWLAVPTTLVAAVLLALRSRPTERVGPGLAV